VPSQLLTFYQEQQKMNKSLVSCFFIPYFIFQQILSFF